MIPVTKPYLPSREKLNQYIDGIYERNWLTNNGPLVQELTARLEKHLGVENLLLVSNGTLALQIAYRALSVNAPVHGKSAEAVTTPFSFIATASSLKWEGIQPVFADIDPQTWCVAPENIEAQITERTRSIVPVHVFGNASDVEAIDAIAKRYNLRVIYDASHAFDVNYKGESLLKYGDAATLSLHATKLFHTVEGGAIIFKCREDMERAKKMVNFGISGPDSIEELGINAKMNEFQAAMGLCVLDEIEGNMADRAKIRALYETELNGVVQLQKRYGDLSCNSAYFPILLETEQKTVDMVNRLKVDGVIARRYFYPSLESVDVLGGESEQPVSSNIAKRVICLPIYSGLSSSDQKRIIRTIHDSI